MRVVHVVRSDAFAGVERYMATVAGALADRGLTVEVIGGDHRRMEALLAPARVQHRAATTSLDVLRALLRTDRADVVHAHMTVAELAALAAGPRLGARVVTTRHFAAPRGVPRAMDRAMSSRFAAQIANSHFTAAHAPGCTTVIPNGVAGGAQVRAGGTNVLIAQRLEPEKSTAEVFPAWAASGLGQLGWKLLVAGDGSQRAALERSVAELGITGSVEFLGARHDVDELRSAAAFQVATGRVESFGLSVAEAMAVGLPVVAADGGGHHELLGDFPELLYTPGDTGSLVSAMQAMARRDDRPALGSQLRAVQRHRHSIDAHVDALVGLYETAAHG